MSYASLLESIDSGDVRTATEILQTDPRLCEAADEPSALMLALYRGLFRLAQTIASRRPSLTVFEAAALGNAASVEHALAADPQAARAVAGDGFTALHLACFFGHAHGAALLLQAFADPNARAGNATRVTPLHSAAAKGDVQICHMLLHAGADLDATQHGGYTALHAAARQGNAPLAEFLVARGADPRLPADDGRRASDIARGAGFLELAKYLDSLLG